MRWCVSMSYVWCVHCSLCWIEKELSALSLVPTTLLTNKHNYFFKLRYKIISAVTRKWNKLSTRVIPKLTSDWLVKKNITENRTLLYGIATYIHICTTSPHSCHPHLGTCRTVALAFAVPRHRTAPPSYAARIWHHPWDLRWCGHPGEESVITWRQVRTVRGVVENLPVEELD